MRFALPRAVRARWRPRRRRASSPAASSPATARPPARTFAKWFGAPSPAPPGRWIKALGDEVTETEFGWMLGADVAACEAAAPRRRGQIAARVRSVRRRRAARRARRPARPSGSTGPAAGSRPVLLVDGVMAGVWAREGDEVTIEPFAPLAQRSAPPPRRRPPACPGAPHCHLAQLISAHAAARHHLRVLRGRREPDRPRSGRAPRGRVPRPRDPDAGRRPPAGPAGRRARPRRVARRRDRAPASRRSRCCRSWPARWPRRAYLAGEDYRRETERLIKEHADGGAVILGRAGAVILRDHPGALHVRLDGPPERRDRAGDGDRGPEPRTTPSACARDGDRAREAYVRHFYGCDATRPGALPPRDRLDRALERDRGRDHRGRGALKFVGALEGLRGYAALLMVVYHAWVLTGGPLLGGGRAVLSGGFLAVDLFFVLSAFVLTLPAARTGELRLLARLRAAPRRADRPRLLRRAGRSR